MPHAYKQKAFTLIELLVVLVVIGLLTSIVMGTVSHVRERADRARNVSQLRMLGLACLNYAMVNDGKVPVNTERYAHRSVGRWVGKGSGLRELLSDRWKGGTGTEDYLASPDSFYGPFTPRLDAARRRGEFVPDNNNYRIGYIYYSLPSATRNENPSNPSLARNLANDYLDEVNDLRTPLLSDIYTKSMIEETGYTGSTVSVVRMDGSVTTFRSEDLAKLQNINTYISIAVLAGIEKPPK